MNSKRCKLERLVVVSIPDDEAIAGVFQRAIEGKAYPLRAAIYDRPLHFRFEIVDADGVVHCDRVAWTAPE